MLAGGWRAFSRLPPSSAPEAGLLRKGLEFSHLLGSFSVSFKSEPAESLVRNSSSPNQQQSVGAPRAAGKGLQGACSEHGRVRALCTVHWTHCSRWGKGSFPGARTTEVGNKRSCPEGAGSVPRLPHDACFPFFCARSWAAEKHVVVG